MFQNRVQRVLDDSVRNHFAAFIAGEIGATALLWRNTPNGHVSANVSETGELLGAEMPAPQWEVSAFPTWVQWSHLILWAMAGSAGELALAPGEVFLPESAERLAFVREEIQKLFSALRQEAARRQSGPSPSLPLKGAKFAETALLKGKGTREDLSNHPVLRTLVTFEDQESLSEEDVDRVYREVLMQAVDLINSHPKIFNQLRNKFMEMLDPMHPRRGVDLREIRQLLVQEFPFDLPLRRLLSQSKPGVALNPQDLAQTLRPLQVRDPSLISTKFLFGVERFRHAVKSWEDAHRALANDVLSAVFPQVPAAK